jgi:TetR/AcrR family transcriptional regulator
VAHLSSAPKYGARIKQQVNQVVTVRLLWIFSIVNPPQQRFLRKRIVPLSTKKSPSAVSGTKDRLLKTALTLFSEKGYAGVSVNDIVAGAKVNKRMVYHYFDNKEHLYQEALSYAYIGLSQFEQETIGAAKSLEKVVKRLVKVYFEFPRIHPEFTQLMLWENLNKGDGIRGSRMRLSKDAVVDRLSAAIERDADGILWRKDLEATQLLITIIGICQVYASHRYTLSQSLHVNLASPAVIKRGIANAEHYLLAGMRPS